MTPETKMAVPNFEARAAMAEMLSAFETFKQTNDERLAQIEAKSSADRLTEDKLQRIDAAIDEAKQRLDRLSLEAARPPLGAGEAKSGEGVAWDNFLRAGDAHGVSEAKALSGAAANTGGSIAPAETEALIERFIRDVSPIRQIATVKQTSSHTLKKPVSMGEANSGWVAETAQRTETETSTLELLEFPTAELYAMPAATPAILNDGLIDIDQWLAEEVRDVFAEAEGTAFVKGTGTNQPKGFLSYTNRADGTQSWGELGYVATGVDGGFPTDDPGDVLIDLIYAPTATHRANGRFVMNKSSVSHVRKFKDADGNYLWQPSLSAGGEASLMGYPVTEAEDMPEIETNAFSIAFGDFQKGYLIVDRQGVQVLRDPFSAKPYVLFYTTRRVGGGVQDFNAIKLLKFGQS